MKLFFFNLKICRISVLDQDFWLFLQMEYDALFLSFLTEVTILTMLSLVNSKLAPAPSIIYRKGNIENAIKSTRILSLQHLDLFNITNYFCYPVHYISNIKHRPLIGEMFFIAISRIIAYSHVLYVFSFVIKNGVEHNYKN